LRFFDDLGICNDADEVIWLIRSEGLCNIISKEAPERGPRFGHFQGLALRVPKNRVPKAQKDDSVRRFSWYGVKACATELFQKSQRD